jgi:hypothetical protein
MKMNKAIAWSFPLMLAMGTAFCGGDPDEPGADEPPVCTAEDEAACPTATAQDTFVMIGTPDHDQHKIDAKSLEKAAEKQKFEFLDPNKLTDAPGGKTQAERALAAVQGLPKDIGVLVVAIHGHGIEGALWFNDKSTLSYKKLFEAIKGRHAHRVFISNDTCFSGTMFKDLPAGGVALCETRAAASANKTTSMCSNGLSQTFAAELATGKDPATALDRAAKSKGVKKNTSRGGFATCRGRWSSRWRRDPR